MSQQPTTTVRLNGRDDLLAAIPGVLGFHPQNSLVLICLGGDSGFRLGRVIRVDLDGAADTAWQLADLAAKHAARVVLAVYADSDAVYDIADLVTAVSSRVEVLDVLEVSNDPQPEHLGLAAEYAAAGRTTMRSRADVLASVQHRRGVASELAEPFLARITSLAARDRLLAELISDTASNLPLLIAALQATPNTDLRLADLAAATAMVAYRHGDGALAQVALDRVFAVTPVHQLASLLMQAISVGIEPAMLDEIVTGL